MREEALEPWCHRLTTVNPGVNIILNPVKGHFKCCKGVPL